MLDLREGGDYDPTKMREFLTYWSKPDARADAPAPK
jgi:hypothetical protein